MNGINKPHSIKSIMGERLRKARTAAGLTRQKLADRLNQNKIAPSAEMTMERLKQWEYGNNTIAIDWIPAICDELSFDVGYLFGEYEEYNRISADIVSETGLTESAVEKLRSINRNEAKYSPIVSILLENFNLEYFLSLLYSRFLYSASTYDVVAPIIESENGISRLKNAQEYHSSINRSEVKIQFDNLAFIAKKRNLLDSMITTSLIADIKEMASTYLERKGDTNNGKHQERD